MPYNLLLVADSSLRAIFIQARADKIVMSVYLLVGDTISVEWFNFNRCMHICICLEFGN